MRYKFIIFPHVFIANYDNKYIKFFQLERLVLFDVKKNKIIIKYNAMKIHKYNLTTQSDLIGQKWSGLWVEVNPNIIRKITVNMRLHLQAGTELKILMIAAGTQDVKKNRDLSGRLWLANRGGVQIRSRGLELAAAYLGSAKNISTKRAHLHARVSS